MDAEDSGTVAAGWHQLYRLRELGRVGVMARYIDEGAVNAMLYEKQSSIYSELEYDKYDGIEKELKVSLIDDIADEISDLPAADVAPVQRWISVEERLPENGERCIFYAECNRAAYTGIIHHVGRQGAVWFATDKRYSTTYTAKWWMPLPEPPEEAQDERG